MKAWKTNELDLKKVFENFQKVSHNFNLFIF